MVEESIVSQYGNYNYLNLKDKYGKLKNKAITLIAATGWGKGLAGAGIAEAFYNEGYTVIVLADPKDEIEYGHAMFEPEAQYHLNELNRFGIKSKAIPTKIYHPFTFQLPKNILIPDYNIFTIPIKDLTAEEFSLLAETEHQKEVVRLMLDACKEISDNAGLHTFLNKVQELVKGKRKGKTIKVSPPFYLEATSGTQKSITEISSLIKPFYRDYFLSSKNNPMNINFKEILNDNKHYHVFCSYYIPYRNNRKVRDFLVLSLVSQIILNAKHKRKPTLLIIPEISNQMPERPEGHQKYLAESMRRLITTCRSQGKGGFSTISDNQTLADMDQSYANSSSFILWGKIVGARDINMITKNYGLKQSIREKLLHPTAKNSFTLMEEKEEEFYIRFPSHMWAEEDTTFNDLFREKFRDKMKFVNNEIELMDKFRKDEEEKFRNKAKRREEELKEFTKEKEERKEGSSAEKKADVKIEKAKKKEEKVKKDLKKLIYEEKLENPEISNRKLGEKFGVAHHTIKRYLKEFENKKEDEEKEDFEEKFVESSNDELDVGSEL